MVAWERTVHHSWTKGASGIQRTTGKVYTWQLNISQLTQMLSLMIEG